MKIELHISGGFAGLSQRPVEVDTRSLGSEGARAERMARGVDWAGLEARSPLRGSGADRFQYRLVMEDQDESRSVVAAEDAVPTDLRPLVDWLLERR